MEIRSTPRSTHKVVFALAMFSRAEGFGAYIPDDDDPEPGRAKDCKELKTAEECRAQGCMYTKATDECAHWPWKNTIGPPPPEPPETLTPTNSPTEPDPTDAPTETPTVATGTPS